MQFDETGPNTHTRRYWVSATVGIAAMIVFAILSILLLLGMVFGSPPDQADRRFAVPLEPAGLRGCGRLDVHRERAFSRLDRRRLHATDLRATRVRRRPHARIKLGV